MPSFSTNLRFVKPVTGEFPDTWGTEVNNGITELVDSAIAGYASIAMMDADYTLTSANGAADQARTMMLNMTGVLSANRNVICPPGFTKLYFIKNATTGGSGYAITLKYSSGSGVSIPNGRSMVLMCDGTNVREAVDYSGNGNFTNISYTGTLTGGTGVFSLGSAAAPSLSFVGDVNTGVWSPAADTYAVSTGGTERMRIDSSGNFVVSAGAAGVGANSTVKGVQLRFDATNNIGYIQSTQSGVANYPLAFNATEHRFLIGATEQVRIDSSGNVGIGVDPTGGGRLNINGNITVLANGRVGYLAETDTSTVAGATVANFGGTYGSAFTGMGGAGVALGGYYGVLLHTAGTERMRIDNSGNVGIGRTSPMVKLDVNGALALSVPTFVSAGTYTVLVSDSCVRFSATCTVTLPAAASFPGRILRIANIGAVAITSASSNVGQQTTGAAGTAILPATAGKWADLHSDGSFWYMTASN